MHKSPHSSSYINPVAQSERIVVLDSIRGVAILGILLMNIPGFGLPRTILSDLSVLNEKGLNFYVWYIFDGFLEGTQRGLFSMLFGAGIILFISRLEKRTEGMMAAELFFRRQIWLAVFGFFNAFVLLWYWDILYHYAICGMLLFPFRRLAPKYLLIGAVFCLLAYTARENKALYAQKITISRGESVAVMDTSSEKLTEKQRGQLTAMLNMKERYEPVKKKEELQKDLEVARGGYITLYKEYSDRSLDTETISMYYFLIWDILLFMFIGMAFFKLGIMQGEASTKLYAWLAIVGLGVGIPLTVAFLRPEIEMNFNRFEVMKKIHIEFYEIARLFRSVGVFGFIMLIYKSGWFTWLFKFLRPVGQMAFTNYLMQSFLCGLFFYGVGFGMFGKLERYQLYFVVLAVWALEITWSHIWLRYFRFGPCEWLWRSLTYWKKQPLRKTEDHLT